MYPDGLNARVLEECSNEIFAILALIFNESHWLGVKMTGDKQMFRRSLNKDEMLLIVLLTFICCKEEWMVLT